MVWLCWKGTEKKKGGQGGEKRYQQKEMGRYLFASAKGAEVDLFQGLNPAFWERHMSSVIPLVEREVMEAGESKGKERKEKKRKEKEINRNGTLITDNIERCLLGRDWV